MTLSQLQALYPDATISSTRSAAHYQDADMSLSEMCKPDPVSGMVTAEEIAASVDRLAAKIARLKA